MEEKPQAQDTQAERDITTWSIPDWVVGGNVPGWYGELRKSEVACGSVCQHPCIVVENE